MRPKFSTYSLQIKRQRETALAALAANRKSGAFAARASWAADLPTTLGATTVSNNADLDAMNVAFTAVMLEAIDGANPIMDLATEVSSTKTREVYEWLFGATPMREWKTDRQMASLEAHKPWTVENKKFESSVRFKNTDFDDDSAGLLPVAIADIAQTASEHPAELVSKALLNGFSADPASPLFPEMGTGMAYDGEQFFSTTHETGSNRLDLAFSGANVIAAQIMLRGQKRFDGTNLRARGTHLFVGATDEAPAEKWLKTETLGDDGKYKLVVVPEFENGEWVLADLSGPMRPILFQTRKPLTTKMVGRGQTDTPGFIYDEIWWGVDARYNASAFEFRRAVGSKPS